MEVVLVIEGPIADGDVPGLCERVRYLLEGSGADLVICDVEALVDPGICTVDALARLQLSARRLGCRIRLRHATPELQELLALVGLGAVVPLWLQGQTEQREQPRGVKERVEPDDATA